MMGADRLRERLGDGEVAYGVVIGWDDPDLVEAAGACGFDFVFVDAEHGALGIHECAGLVRAAACERMATLIRVPYADTRGVYRYLDAGASGLIFPHVRSAADARAVVAACMFPPEGSRGALSSSRAARYGTAGAPFDYYRSANAAVWAVPMIEDAESVEHLRDILAVPGIRAVFIGPGDLALSHVGWEDSSLPSVEHLVHRAVVTSTEAGKVVATVAGTPAAAAALAGRGVRVIAVGAMGLFTGACRAFLQAAPRAASRADERR
jgi:2-keto-3-deoxy-L-rhamnonate aldolase RhmA